MADPQDSDSTLQVHGAVINAEPKTSANNSLPLSFCKRHKNKLFTLATVIILAAIVIPSAVVGVRNSHVSTHSTVNTSSNDNSTDEFDDSKQLNAETPPLNQLFQYGGSPIRGVNLGGWLVLEPFITPSIFEQFDPAEGVIDEWTLCEKLGLDEAKKQLQDHYDTFITEDDFKKISTMGINHVRIPTGHWAVNPIEGEPFVPNLAWEYLLKGIQWARKYGIRVMVELHTAPGSQNGWNHSGRVGSIGWLNGSYGELNANHTINTVLPMVEYFSRPEWSNVVTIFGVLNEPAIYRLNRERASDWYLESYYAIRNVTGEGKGPILTYHEGFIGLSKWKGFMPNTTFDRTILETHTYLIFDQGLVSMNRNSQSEFPCKDWKKDLQTSRVDFGQTMVGEFSAATNDCAKYLNGIGIGARYDGTFTNEKPAVCSNCTCNGTEDWNTWDDDYKQFLRRFIERQMDAFESNIGWFFWNFKTENHVNPHWDYLLGVEQGWIPQNAGDRTYSCEDVPTDNFYMVVSILSDRSLHDMLFDSLSVCIWILLALSVTADIPISDTVIGTVGDVTTSGPGYLILTKPSIYSRSSTLYAIGNKVEFTWKYDDRVVFPPRALTFVLVSPIKEEFIIGENITGSSKKFVWDTAAFEDDPDHPRLMSGKYIVRIWDERGPDAPAAEGRMMAYRQPAFSLYPKQQYQDIDSSELVY